MRKYCGKFLYYDFSQRCNHKTNKALKSNPIHKEYKYFKNPTELNKNNNCKYYLNEDFVVWGSIAGFFIIVFSLIGIIALSIGIL